MQIDRGIFREVAQLKLSTPVAATGGRAGDRRSPYVGRGVEFADYRPYTPGDDLRLVDWNVYQRLQMVLVRLFHEDRNMSVQIVIDCSESMAFGTPRKADHAGTLGAAMALIGLMNRDSVSLGCAGGSLPMKILKAANQNGFARILQYLEMVEPKGVEDSIRAIKAHFRSSKPDRLFFISDMLKSDEEINRILRIISASSRRPVLLHVLGDEELSPDLSVPQRVIDAENHEELRVRGGRAAARAYQAALDEYLVLLERECRALRIHYLRAFTNLNVPTLLNSVLRRGRVVQSASGATR